jgi:hypothetical protein
MREIVPIPLRYRTLGYPASPGQNELALELASSVDLTGLGPAMGYSKAGQGRHGSRESARYSK